jgi:thiol-disulfide isomerase/thioredoxin
MSLRIAATVLAILLPAAAHAIDRVQIYALEEGGCAQCPVRAVNAIRKVKGVKKVVLDPHGPGPVITVTMANGVTDAEILAAAMKGGGLEATLGPTPQTTPPAAPKDYPPDADVKVLSSDGSKVGPLEKLVVPGKYTVFDVYADWCLPCRQMEARLRDIVAGRKDVAVRRLNVVDFESPLGQEIPGLEALPHVIVYTPTGKHRVVRGLDLPKLDAALAAP